jgi:hypothetical protein
MVLAWLLFATERKESQFRELVVSDVHTTVAMVLAIVCVEQKDFRAHTTFLE